LINDGTKLVSLELCTYTNSNLNENVILDIKEKMFKYAAENIEKDESFATTKEITKITPQRLNLHFYKF
jgi:hypothetical protein